MHVFLLVARVYKAGIEGRSHSPATFLLLKQIYKIYRLKSLSLLALVAHPESVLLISLIVVNYTFVP